MRGCNNKQSSIGGGVLVGGGTSISILSFFFSRLSLLVVYCFVSILLVGPELSGSSSGGSSSRKNNKIGFANAYVPQVILDEWKEKGFEKAIETIEECANVGQPKEELYGAVRFIDRNAHLIYNTDEEKQALFERSFGCWELRLAYEDCKSQIFLPYPDFRDFAMACTMIDSNYFGKGIFQNPNFCFVALGGPATFNVKKRQLYMSYEDFYISGRQVPEWDLSYFMRGYARNWVAPSQDKKKKKSLAFTPIVATDKILAVRGSKTGGMAIFRRVNDDLRPSAYGS